MIYVRRIAMFICATFVRMQKCSLLKVNLKNGFSALA